jgi:DNA-binding CsgD family transcriptional regulator
MIVIMLSPPADGQWVYFAVNRADPDFTDAELALCVRLQPALVALYTHLTAADEGKRQGEGQQEAGPVTLTRREHAVLGYLADGLTAEAIAHRMSVKPATVRKHLQNLYGKLGTSDRLGAVIRGRELGLLGAEDLSREFTWNVRYDMERARGRWGTSETNAAPADER